MKKLFFILHSSLFTLHFFTFSTAFAQPRQVHILAVNDMHATIDVFPQLAALADSLRAVDPSLLVFSAGDNRTGNPLNDKYAIPAYPMVALMNQVGFNGSALGNHEFDVHSLPRLTALSHFRYICANIFPHDTVGLHTVPCQVFDVGGLKVGVVGAIQVTSQGIPSTHPDNVRGIRFADPKETIGQYEWLSRICDITILLSHIGYPDDVAMAKAYPWLDLIIGGHTHTQLTGKERVNNVLITQNKNKFQGSVTYITLTVDSGRVVDKQAEYIDVKNFPRRSPLVESMVNYFSSNPEFLQVVAQAATPFDVREELGCMICDAYMSEMNADIAVENPGGVRLDSHPAGDITLLDVLAMDPFDNHAVTLNLTGEQLLTMMLTYSRNNLYSFPFVGGIRCELTVDQNNKIKRARLLTLDGKKLNMKKTYRVVTNNYITATSKIPEGSAQEHNILTTDLIVNHLRKQRTVNYQGQRRLTIEY